MSPPASMANQPAEQLRYARLLDVGARIGLVLLVLAFTAYVSGLLSPLVPVSELPKLWSLPVERYLAETGTPTGWGWLVFIGKGDVAGLAGIVLLSSCSLVCLLALVPLYLHRGDRRYVILCLAEIAVLLLAASGWLTKGH